MIFGKKKRERILIEAGPVLVKLRVGMWVVFDNNEIGIYLGRDNNRPDKHSVMLVDDYGLNRLQIPCDIRDLRQATYKEIPKPRRPAKKLAMKLGYEV